MTRKYIVFLTFVVSLFMAANASAQYTHIKNIVGSDHDLSPTGTGYQVQGGFTEICFFCHIPHPSTSAAANTPPLWNHALSTVASYGVYVSPTFNTLTTNIADLGGATAGTAVISNLCLSCHDGTVGMNTVINTGSSGYTQNAGMKSVHSGNVYAAGSPVYLYSGLQIGASASTIGLRADHPINFTYDATLTAQVANLVTPTALGTNGYSTGVLVAANTTLGTAATELPLFSYTYAGGHTNTMQCSTCHEVHDPTYTPFLRMPNTESVLCLGCHGN